ncbi:hypothetical protein SAMN05444156_1192 [Verrucomicrobium sp. GAS474]|uniref:MGH1-like glycoside hydrolase domain-containing protein n=1 Tax=Verrucomicrobium sp. GAS474 TaxID=1882831 RepID=UPI0008794AFB|nr:glucosidase [Verrucomicrobium sp. GAS474]SDT97563.1 hypothetical protein SAMN05444156_1192 [Verrucomicrobium sp. GAS474]
MSCPTPTTAEHARLSENRARTRYWKRWGPYLSDRQWATVREDYSADGNTWTSFPHEQARSRAYRWGEDGLFGISDSKSRLCFALALWNGNDPILKERLFGLTGPEGNHGEDVKEAYFHLDATPTHSYLKALYKYPHAAFPYDHLVQENAKRDLRQPEYELEDTGIFDEGRYHDVVIEYAKDGPEDIVIRITATNRGPEKAVLHLLPTLWFRNTWAWGNRHEKTGTKPVLKLENLGPGPNFISARHEQLGLFHLAYEEGEPLFTENETNAERLWKTPNVGPFVKDALHRAVVNAEANSVNPDRTGTKCAIHTVIEVEPGVSKTVRLRLRLVPEGSAPVPSDPFADFDALFQARKDEADAFYNVILPESMPAEERNVARQGYAGLIWSKQFYHYIVEDWIEGDPATPTLPSPPPGRGEIRNGTWGHLYSEDILSMPDKWEYPWFAAWDTAFHMIPMARIDPEFAKRQLLLFLREWYMHPNGQLPAYEFSFSDVNPPVHAWAVWRVYKMTGERGERDRAFLEAAFQKLLLNFTWWVNRKDTLGNNLFSGGFLGLDNIGVFDRSKPLPGDGFLEQADGTAWMGFYCLTMLSMALELAQENPVYQDMASKFFEHFIAITDAINTIGGTGLWDEADGFFYDVLQYEGQGTPLRTRSLVGLLPLIAVEVLEMEQIEKLPGFARRMAWFLNDRKDLPGRIACCVPDTNKGLRLLSLSSRERMKRVARYVLDETEFLSEHGLRSVSKAHLAKPYVLKQGDAEYTVGYEPGEGTTRLFGGNSNWRGPVWFPINFLLVEAMERYHHFYGDEVKVECPAGSGKRMTLKEASREISRRLTGLFLPDAAGNRPCHGGAHRFASDPHWKDLVLFHEYFHGDTGKGLGASHQTGWTALTVKLLESQFERG